LYRILFVILIVFLAHKGAKYQMHHIAYIRLPTLYNDI